MTFVEIRFNELLMICLSFFPSFVQIWFWCVQGLTQPLVTQRYQLKFITACYWILVFLINL